MSVIQYEFQDKVATICLDDGKGNAVSFALIEQLHKAFDRAQSDNAKAVVLIGRKGLFSAGFELHTLMAGNARSADLLRDGFLLADRLIRLPIPLITACTGHCLAMGLFLLLCGDFIVGAENSTTSKPWKIVANEVAIGLTMPLGAVEMLRYRLTPAYFNRAAITSEHFSPEEAVKAGIFDVVVPPDKVQETAQAKAMDLVKLNAHAYATTKLRVRDFVLSVLPGKIEADDTGFRKQLAGKHSKL